MPLHDADCRGCGLTYTVTGDEYARVSAGNEPSPCPRCLDTDVYVYEQGEKESAAVESASFSEEGWS
jgi:hypothetical protein